MCAQWAKVLPQVAPDGAGVRRQEINFCKHRDSKKIVSQSHSRQNVELKNVDTSKRRHLQKCDMSQNFVLFFFNNEIFRSQSI
jgi:hypothetical protein